MPFETSVEMPFWGTRAELYEVMALGRAGLTPAACRPSRWTETTRPTGSCAPGEIHGRAVIVP